MSTHFYKTGHQGCGGGVNGVPEDIKSDYMVTCIFSGYNTEIVDFINNPIAFFFIKKLDPKSVNFKVTGHVSGVCIYMKSYKYKIPNNE